MINIKLTILLLLGYALLVMGCQPSSEPAEAQLATQPETIQLLAQSRPGGEAFEFDMPIDKGLDKLEIADPTSITINNDELVLGISIGERHLALPIRYMSGFEVANLFIDSSTYLLTWCPLVGSARIFEGEINGNKAGFDFGRGLIENNLLIVDRHTHTVWNQLSCKGVKGELEGESLLPLASIQSTWSFWKTAYPETSVLVNKDTSGAVFPSSVLQKQYYNAWVPGEKYPERNQVHEIKNLGLGIELEDSAVFFPLEKLFTSASPIVHSINGTELVIKFEESGLVAWAEDKNGKTLPGTMVYDWAWKNFFPESEIY